MKSRETIEWLRGYAPTQQDIRLCARILDVCDMAAVSHDLLEACEMLVDAVEQFKEFSDESAMEPDEAAYQGDAINKARIAIAKAKKCGEY